MNATAGSPSARLRLCPTRAFGDPAICLLGVRDEISSCSTPSVMISMSAPMPSARLNQRGCHTVRSPAASVNCHGMKILVPEVLATLAGLVHPRARQVRSRRHRHRRFALYRGRGIDCDRAVVDRCMRASGRVSAATLHKRIRDTQSAGFHRHQHHRHSQSTAGRPPWRV